MVAINPEDHAEVCVKHPNPATLRETMSHSLWVFVPSGQLEDGYLVLNSVREETVNRSKYALDEVS